MTSEQVVNSMERKQSEIIKNTVQRKYPIVAEDQSGEQGEVVLLGIRAPKARRICELQ